MNLSKIYDLMLTVAVGALLVVSFGWWNQRKAHRQEVAVRTEVMVALLAEKMLWNRDFLEVCLIEIKEEVQTISKFSNIGLIDTLQWIDSLVQMIGSKGDAELRTTFQQYQSQLDSLVHMPNPDGHQLSYIHEYCHPDVDPLIFRSQLLDWEKAALSYFNERLGGGSGCILKIDHKLYMVPEHGAWEVVEGSTFNATAYVKWMDVRGNLFLTADKTTAQYHLDRGFYLQTRGLIPAGQQEIILPFTVTLNVVNAAGRPDTLSQQCRLKIKRRPVTARP